MPDYSCSHSRRIVCRLHGVRFVVGACLCLSCGIWVGCEAPEISPSASGEGAEASAAIVAQEPASPPAAPAVEEPHAVVEEPVAAPPVEETAQGTDAPSDNLLAVAQPLMETNGCMRCHRIDAEEEPGGFGGPPPEGFAGAGPGWPEGGGPDGPGPGGPPPGGGFGGPPRGPNLAHVTANPEHTVDWIADHIRDPKSHNPRSRMPAYAEKMGDDEIVQIANFLATPNDNQFADAEPMMEANGCMRCHRIDANEEPGDFGGPPPGGFAGPGPGGPDDGQPDGPGGPPPGGGFGGPPRGPNLAHVGANVDHTVDWIADHIRDPKTHNPRSRMPAYAEKMSDEEIQQVAAYLATLK